MSAQAIYLAVAIPAATFTIVGGLWRFFRYIGELISAIRDLRQAVAANTLENQKIRDQLRQLTRRVHDIERAA